MDSGLRVHFVLGLAPMVSIVLGLQTAVHPSQLAPAVREVQGVAPVVRISHGTPISRWRLIGAVIRSPLKTPLQQVGRLMRPALNPTDTARCRTRLPASSRIACCRWLLTAAQFSCRTPPRHAVQILQGVSTHAPKERGQAAVRGGLSRFLGGLTRLRMRPDCHWLSRRREARPAPQPNPSRFVMRARGLQVEPGRPVPRMPRPKHSPGPGPRTDNTDRIESFPLRPLRRPENRTTARFPGDNLHVAGFVRGFLVSSGPCRR